MPAVIAWALTVEKKRATKKTPSTTAAKRLRLISSSTLWTRVATGRMCPTLVWRHTDVVSLRQAPGMHQGPVRFGLRCRRLFWLSGRISRRSRCGFRFRQSRWCDVGGCRCRFNSRCRCRMDFRFNIEAPHEPTDDPKDNNVKDYSDWRIHWTNPSAV